MHMMRVFCLIAMLALTTSTVSAIGVDTVFNTGDSHLDVALAEINVQAKADLGAFQATLNLKFASLDIRLGSLLTEFQIEPAEVYLVAEFAEVTQTPIETVVDVYQKNKGRGWGQIARELGIKPGSTEFHELKARLDSIASGNKTADAKANKGKGKKK